MKMNGQLIGLDIADKEEIPWVESCLAEIIKSILVWQWTCQGGILQEAESTII
jgi:hypothetical protein